MDSSFCVEISCISSSAPHADSELQTNEYVEILINRCIEPEEITSEKLTKIANIVRDISVENPITHINFIPSIENEEECILSFYPLIELLNMYIANVNIEPHDIENCEVFVSSELERECYKFEEYVTGEFKSNPATFSNMSIEEIALDDLEQTSEIPTLRTEHSDIVHRLEPL